MNFVGTHIDDTEQRGRIRAREAPGYRLNVQPAGSARRRTVAIARPNRSKHGGALRRAAVSGGGVVCAGFVMLAVLSEGRQ
jgi:hypothetical protein